jgi:hypothetical protein
MPDSYDSNLALFEKDRRLIKQRERDLGAYLVELQDRSLTNSVALTYRLGYRAGWLMAKGTPATFDEPSSKDDLPEPLDGYCVGIA